MTILESAKTASYEHALYLLDENETVTKTVPMFAPIKLSARTTLDAVYAQSQRKLMEKKGPAATKEEVQTEVGEQSLAIAKIIGTYGSVNNDTMLQEKMKFSWKELFNGTDQGLTDIADIVLQEAGLIRDKLEPFGITPSLLNNYSQLLDDYRVKVGSPRRGIINSSDAGKMTGLLLKDLKKIFTEQLDPMMLLFKKTEPSFYNRYKVSRVIINPATHKTKLEGVAKDKKTGTPLPGVLAKMEERDLSVISGADGSYTLLVPPNKKLNVTFTLEGYKPVTVVVFVKRGKVQVQDVELELV